ncbi:MAG: ATP-binding protein [Arcobacteraceae bacterium]
MQNQYQEAIENSNIVSKTNIDGIITFVNDEFCNLFGYTKEELLGINHNIIRHPEVPSSTFKILWETIKTEKKPYKSTVKNLTKDNKTVYLNTTITPILNKNNEIEEFIAIRYDVTKEMELTKHLEQKDKELNALNETLEQRVLEQTRQLQELNSTLEQRVLEEIKKNEEKQKILFLQSRLASLGQMLANIAHQWRQPLTELSLTLFNINKTSRKCCENEKVLEYYEEGKFIIKNMSKTIDDFTNFFAPNKLSEPFFLNESITEALEILKKLILREKITIRTNFEKLKVVGISNELSQVLINLIQNANDAFNQNKITHKKIIIKTYKTEDNFAVIEVKDNALGIPNDHIEQIFEPYFTTKHTSSGTGLGLFMSKLIIEKSLSGTIEVRNYEEGSIFTIKIPIWNKS